MILLSVFCDAIIPFNVEPPLLLLHTTIIYKNTKYEELLMYLLYNAVKTTVSDTLMHNATYRDLAYIEFSFE